ncbi:MAG: glycoside hydrolase family 3 C-terminal domain-containing protein [Bacteroidales bacterium]|nr:glycoside hydrolase family 3 C-terminal domain-containing protein [Bacteroidales bacterium]
MRYNFLLILLTVIIITSLSCKKQVHTSDIADSFVDSLLQKMTLEEKLGQLTLYTSDWDVTGPVMRDSYKEDIRAGRCGNVYNALTVDYNRMLQKMAVEETRLGIPMLFGYDVIHGYKTIFPIPLAEACSWDIPLIQESARLSAREAAASGINWVFAPMVDISRDSRWGRVAEGAGEDAYLGSLIAAAKVRGIQGERLDDPFTVAACIKHFAGYGAPVAGKDYNTVDMSELSFRQDYLPPYKAGIEAGAATVMASFNEIFGVPAACNKFLLTEILRKELNFKGFVVTDYMGVNHLIPHGVASDKQEAGILAINAGTDMDMQSGIYYETLEKSLNEGKVSLETINQSVRRVLKLKYQLGLFADPYLYFNNEREKTEVYTTEASEHALLSAKESIVLLKNDGFKGRKNLPISKQTKKIALIGPLGNSQIDMLGCWHAAGEASRTSTVLDGLRKEFPDSQIKYMEGCDFSSPDKSGFKKALSLAAESDVIIVAIGEQERYSGEATSRSDIGIPGVQEELAEELIKTGKPVVILILAERALCFPELAEKASSILYAWHLGTRAGDAIAAVLSGDFNPSGKLVMTIPRSVGQIPIYYNYKNTGRPYKAGEKFSTQYIDESVEPLYPFGYGLSYTQFEYGSITLSADSIAFNDTLHISCTIKNTGMFDGSEISELYIRDMVASVTRPVKELKGFKKIYLKKGEQQEINFSLCSGDLKFYNSEMKYVCEPGKFKVFIGTSSAETQEGSFTLKEK